MGKNSGGATTKKPRKEQQKANSLSLFVDPQLPPPSLLCGHINSMYLYCISTLLCTHVQYTHFMALRSTHLSNLLRIATSTAISAK